MVNSGKDTLKTKKTLKSGGKNYTYFSLPEASKALGVDISRLPFSLKILLENLLRYEDGGAVKVEDVKALVAWLKDKKSDHEIAFLPARVLMQDFTGVPAVVDLAAMRDAMKSLGGDPKKINPLTPVDLVIDHSVMVDYSASKDAFEKNVDLEMERNIERYEFLRWGQEAFDNFRVVPPGTGICHQVNLEYLAKVAWTRQEGKDTIVYPDSLVGTDSHTTMINGLAVLGWGVGGIEAEAVMLGQPISMVLPEVIGFKLTGSLKEGSTATDLVLTVTQMLRAKGVVNKFVEFYGPGLNNLALADRATIANMAPEYGATCGFFPVDEETIKYLKLSARDDATVALAEDYAKAQGLWREKNAPDPVFTDTLELDMSSVEPSVAGPKRPQDKIVLSKTASEFKANITKIGNEKSKVGRKVKVEGKHYELTDGDVVIAAITSCTNTSNPSVMMAAGLVAKKAAALGLTRKPWVKTSLAPGSKVVTEYLKAAGLEESLNKVGFDLVGYGCTTCIGNSGPLEDILEKTIKDNDLLVASVLSGNRNFEGRVHPQTRANYLMSPPLVVAYAIAGNMTIDLTKDPIAKDKNGKDVYLKDIWPSNKEVNDTVSSILTAKMFKSKYADVFKGDKHWQNIKVAKGMTYSWSNSSTYIANPPYFVGMKPKAGDISEIKGASILALLGDSITTDHISPAGNISKTSPAAVYLKEHKVEPKDFNSYGARRGNHEVMMRGTFANIRIKNEMCGGKEGGFTIHIPSGKEMPIYDAAMEYMKAKTPLVIFAGKEYGTGSSRDWAAKGTLLLGVKAVVAESFERIHRSNLVGMGVLPLLFKDGMTRKSLNLDGTETIDISGFAGKIKPRMDVDCTITRKNGKKETIKLLCRIDTVEEVGYFKNGGILHNVVRHLMSA
ncbi:MAG: aconitate hydratase AcnA [Proteobacteria bacterium]|nr:aconitate hydratase AcnA [Pseudomonadota bacterium]